MTSPEELGIVSSWFSETERKTGRCRCGQRLWEMPMMDCQMQFHHDPDFIPSNPSSPYFAAWIKGEI